MQEEGKQLILKQREFEVQKTEKINSGKLGLLDSLTALHSYPGSTWPTWLVRLLFIFIEIAPVFFKLMIAYSAYDYLQENLKYTIMASNGIEAKEGYSKLENGEIHDQIIYHEALNVHEHRHNQLKAELEVLKNYIKDWKEKEMNKASGQDENSIS